MAAIVLVPGGFTGSWMWSDVVDLLAQHGLEVIAPDLPSIGPGGGSADFYADVRAVQEVLDGLTAPVLLCGHSYGGGVITDAAAGPHPAVRRLVYLNATIPDAGDTLNAMMAAAAAAAPQRELPNAALTIRADGLAELGREHAGQILFNDCSPERAEQGLDLLQPASIVGGGQPLTGAAWREIPSTYVTSTLDPLPVAVSPDFFAQQPERVELPTGHCPNWSRPDLVAELLRARAVALSG